MSQTRHIGELESVHYYKNPAMSPAANRMYCSACNGDRHRTSSRMFDITISSLWLYRRQFLTQGQQRGKQVSDAFDPPQ